MAELIDLDTTDANNTTRFPENMQFRNVNDGARAVEGMLARWLNDNNGTLTASGSAGAFTVTSNQTITSYYDGLTLSFQANHAPTGAVTLNLNGLGAKSVKSQTGATLRTGEITSGAKVKVVYQSTAGEFRIEGGIGLPTSLSPVLEVGSVTIWPTGTAPTGWLECDGSAVSRTTYASLYAKIGVIYGNGDGSTTFNLPDYRGYFLRGFDNGAGTDPDAASRTDRGDGTTGDNVGTLQANETESHTHGPGTLAGTTDDPGTHTHTYTQPSGSVNVGSSGLSAVSGGVSSNTGADGAHTHTVDIDSGVTGSDGGNETRPVNVSVMFCILAVPMANAAESSNPQATPSGNIALSNGRNDNVDPSSYYKLRVTGPSAAFGVSGIVAPANDGAVMRIYNPVAQDFTIYNENANSTAANRITTLTGSDVTLTGVSACTLCYDSTDARWILMSTQG